jgi:rRNA maturation endonuclease Nob1
MSSNCYIIDTSSLIELNKHNPRDVYPGVWKKIERLINSDRLVAPKEVFNEIKQIDDSLSRWAKNQSKMFIEPTYKQIERVKEILNKYPSLIKVDRKYDADPWVVALAIELTTNPQKTLLIVKRIVVTEEKLRGNTIRIPFICEEYTIEAIDIIDMFRTEGWKF